MVVIFQHIAKSATQVYASNPAVNLLCLQLNTVGS